MDGASTRLVNFWMDNASSTKPVLEITNDGSGDSILDDSTAKLTAAGVWTDASSTFAEKDIIGDADISNYLTKLKGLKLYEYQKKAEVYGKRSYEQIEITEEEYEEDNPNHKVGSPKDKFTYYKEEGEKKFKTKKKNSQARHYKGYVLDDPNTPEELISRDSDGNISGVSSADGVNFLLGVCKQLVERIEALESA